MARISPLRQRQQHFDKLGDLAPGFSFALETGARSDDKYYQSFPFKRSLPAILICGSMLAAFSIPLFSVGASLGRNSAELSSFVSLAFSMFWMLGWSVGVLLIALVLLILILGRETVHVTADALVLRVGVPGIGFGLAYPRELVRRFRRSDLNQAEKTGADRGTAWRGEHLLFDFAGQPVAFGSAVSQEQAASLLAKLQMLFPDQGGPLPDIQTGSVREPVANPGVESQALDQAGNTDGSTIGWRSPSALALIAANLIPLVGVIAADWNIGDLMLLFWAESAVIGIYNLLKMARVAGWTILLLGPFFVAHYGGFMVGHLLFIYTLFVNGLDGGTDIPLTSVVDDFFTMLPALLAFVASHGVSYVQNFLGRKEYLGRDANAQMGQPYKRIVIMHVTIIFGGFMVLALGSALPALILLIALKLGADLYAHLREHRKVGAADKRPPE